MELRHLRYFVVVAEEENVMRAAERLHVAQSALSRQIMALEKDLGVALFERQHRRIRLSDAGRLYLADIRRVLDDIQQINERTRRYAAGQSGTLGISVTNAALSVPVVSRSLNSFRSGNAGVTVNLSHMYSPQQMQALRAGSVDAAFVFHLRDDEEQELEWCELGEDRYLLALPSIHPLAAARELRLADLRDQPFLWKQAGGRDPVMAACLAAGLAPRIVQRVERMEISPTLVAEGMGMAFVLSYNRFADPRVAFREIADLDVRLHLDLMWKRGNSSVPLARFVETVRQNRQDAPHAAAGAA